MWSNEYQPERHGYQVLLSMYNEESCLENCLLSLDESLKDKSWILLVGDDDSTDNSLVELARYVEAGRITADKVHLYEYDKASTVGEAKNRLIKEAHNFKEDYQSILFMDADDDMLPERPNMIHTAVEKNSPFVVGAWEKNPFPFQPRINNAQYSVDTLRFGPWATLFDCNFLPEDGVFFPEHKIFNTGFEDLLLWYHLKYIKDIVPVAHSSKQVSLDDDTPVHRYRIRKEGGVDRVTASRPADKGSLNYNRNTFWGLSELIKDHSRDIFKNPPSREEAEEAMENYINRKEYENSRSKSVDPQGPCQGCGQN
jgi:glycosyltransferase involved in cell wall biosynthesis